MILVFFDIHQIFLRLTKRYSPVSMEDGEPGLQAPQLPTVYHANPSTESPNHNQSEKGQTLKIKEFFANEINTKYVYIPMLVCCLITGFVDGTLYNGKHSPRPNKVIETITKLLCSIRHLCLYANRYDSLSLQSQNSVRESKQAQATRSSSR